MNAVAKSLCLALVVFCTHIAPASANDGAVAEPTAAPSSASAPASNASSASSSRAQKLFDDGLSLAKEKRFEEACKLFEASQKLEARTGTLLNLATCYERTWRTASAWAAYRDAEGLARREERPDLQERAAAARELLEPQLVRLTVRVPATSRVPGLRVTLDEHELLPAEYDQPIPVDPGSHRLRAAAPGLSAWEKTVTLAKQSGSETVPVLQKQGFWTTGRKVAVPVAAVGVGALVAGSVLALVAHGDYQSAKSTCAGGGVTGCAPGSTAKAEDARSLMTPATALFVSGAVVAGAGVTLFLVAKPRSERTAPERAPQPASAPQASVRLQAGPGSLWLQGTFN